MAFVFKDDRDSPNGKPTVPARVGPGSYDIDGTLQKEFMAQIYPKKVAPFNQTETRNVVQPVMEPKLNVPGPGAYGHKPSDFEQTFELKNAKERGTYFLKDKNGILNRKPQPFGQRQTKDSFQRPAVEVPGPGQYESKGIFEQSPSGNKHNQSFFGRETRDGSPRQTIDSLPKMSVPSIPSRFLTPTMDMAPKQLVDKNERIQSIDGYTMSRLVDDPAKVGPQSYFPIYEQTSKMTQGTIDWNNSRSQRPGIPNPQMTQPLVGPGYYNLGSKIDRSIQNMSIPRQGRNVDHVGPKKQKESVSIRDTFDEYDEDSDDDDPNAKRTSPGPGHYATHDSSFLRNQGKYKKQLLGGNDQFGSRVGRFNDKPWGTELGPGQYVNKLGMGRRAPGLLAKGKSAAFKSMERNNIFRTGADLPGPGDYLNDRVLVTLGHGAEKLKNSIANRKKLAGFGVNKKRFDKDDTLPPGPGQYKAPDSCVIHNKGHIHYGYKSNTQRDLKLEIGLKNPGVGDYNLKDHHAIGVQKIQGGAPNNFLILTKNIDPSIRKVDPKVSPRLPDNYDPTPQGIGPGCYFKNSKVYNLHQLKSANLI